MQIGLDDTTDLAHLAQELPEQADLLESDDDAPIIRLINAVLTQAIRENASDIHIEPFENRAGGALPRRRHAARRAAVQARASRRWWSRASRSCRSSTSPRSACRRTGASACASPAARSTCASRRMPTGHGERVVLRLLDKQAGRLDLNSLGMGADTRAAIDELIHKPHGILLVTGPTGSGKTTTLYAALERLNDNTQNIMTVEDPIEYDIDGIGQTQVNTKVEMTFARGLRAILRQDPDVVHGRRNPRPRDRADRRAGEPHRPPGAVDAAHQHRRRRAHAAARHGRRAVPALLEPDRRAGTAPGARAESRDAPGLHGRRIRTAAARTQARRSLADAVSARARCRRRLPRPHRHLRADPDRRSPCAP